MKARGACEQAQKQRATLGDGIGRPSARRRLVVHIGLPKCGSTSIQRCLPELAASGLYVPRTCFSRLWGNHNNLVRCLSGESYSGRPWRQPEAVWQSLRDEIRSCPSPTVLLSAELFTAAGFLTGTPGEEVAARIAGLASACRLEVRLLAYVRPQFQLLEALYAQMAAKGRTHATFETFSEAVLADGLLDFNRLFAPWRERFDGRLAVWPLEATAAAGGLVPHFRAQIGASGIPADGQVPRNVRIGAKELEVRRLANAGLVASGISFPRRHRLLGGRFDGLPKCFDGDAPFAPMTPGVAAAVAARFAASNARFAREVGWGVRCSLIRERTPCAGRVARNGRTSVGRSGGVCSGSWSGPSCPSEARGPRCFQTHSGRGRSPKAARDQTTPRRWRNAAASAGGRRLERLAAGVS